MISLKIQLKDKLNYLLALQPSDLKDLSVKDAVITVDAGESKVHLMHWSDTREALLERLKEEGGLIDAASKLVKP